MRGYRLVDANRHLALFQVGGETDNDFFVCDVKRKRRFFIGGSEGPGGTTIMGPVRLAGRFAAYASITCDKYGVRRPLCTINVTILNTSTAKRSRYREGSSSYSRQVSDLELTAGGAAAWITAPLFPSTPREPADVHKADADGQALLDSGPEIPPDSLALGGSTIYWTNAGQARSALLR